MQVLKDFSYDNSVYAAITSESILKTKTLEEQIEIINLIGVHSNKDTQKVCHSENMNEISSIKSLKMYLEKLKAELGQDTDVNSCTRVSKYNEKEKIIKKFHKI